MATDSKKAITHNVPFWKHTRNEESFIICHYTPEMSKYAASLEDGSISNLKGLFVAQKVFGDDYTIKLKNYEDGFILMGLQYKGDNNDHKDLFQQEQGVFNKTHFNFAKDFNYCGVIQCGIKTVFLERKPSKVGYLFSLRVNPSFKRRGLGTALTKSVSKVAQEKRVDLIYLSVNGNNNGAIFLYKKVGYQEADTRKIRIHPLLFRGCSCSKDMLKAEFFGYKETDKIKAYMEGSKELRSVIDLTPVNTLEYFQRNPGYLGSAFLSKNNKIVAGISFVKKSKYGSMYIKRAICSINVLIHPLFAIVVTLAVAAISYLIYSMILNSCFKRTSSVPSALFTAIWGLFTVFVVFSILTGFFILDRFSKGRGVLRPSGFFLDKIENYDRYWSLLLRESYHSLKKFDGILLFKNTSRNLADRIEALKNRKEKDGYTLQESLNQSLIDQPKTGRKGAIYMALALNPKLNDFQLSSLNFFDPADF